MRRTSLAALLLAAIMAGPARAGLADEASAYFVSPAGSDANAGTMAAPFQTALASGDPLTWDVVASAAAWATIETHLPARREGA